MVGKNLKKYVTQGLWNAEFLETLITYIEFLLVGKVAKAWQVQYPQKLLHRKLVKVSPKPA